MSEGKLSFTIRRPPPSASPSQPVARTDLEPPPSRPNGRLLPPGIARARSSAASRSSPLARTQKRFAPVEDDSSEEEGTEDEIITGFDELGVERCAIFTSQKQADRNSPQGFGRAHKPRQTAAAHLVIAPLPNKDWRQSSYAKRHAAERYLPPGARERAEAEKAGEMDTRDVINSGPQLAGLTLAAPKLDDFKMEEKVEVKVQPEEEVTVKMEVEETLEQRALRALLTGEDEKPHIDTIPMHVPTEAEAYQDDVVTRPDSPTLDDYKRVPIEEFGAALLRGMGWKPGEAASRTRTGPTEPWLPKARPAFLGLGAKARPEDTLHEEDKDKSRNRKAAMKYVPLVKRVAEVKTNGESGSSSARSSDDEGRSLSRPLSRSDRERDRDRDRSDREGERERRRDRDYDRDRDRRRESDRDETRYSDREDRRDRDRDWRSDRDRDRPSDGQRERERDEYKERNRDRDSRRYDDKEKDSWRRGR
ncbi:hypothetical protein DACRYDRAFT_118638 [Dacryopinax primogenitus]|uniref:G-patch domain-containing protein n=1 Tax=Dacryopinax primogenitus (strain DJM 731) TaxID=1858805 RepID=M5FSU1_DACPD|nr:uncharacterized protein DACRYDRAFT_118638 [Dacryopinax primogenitus]EJT98339.1 hypothetical protein DACRYDRAFT_118638 [Dacryopinax primogenitus]